MKANRLALRRLILHTARGVANLGGVVETIKWGQPAYLPARPRVGSTIRLGTMADPSTADALFVHCQSTLVPTFRRLYGEELEFVANRGMVLHRGQTMPRRALAHGIELSLTYHWWKNAPSGPSIGSKR
ncbi:MAG: DUF1801 domain-containing protein [Myxococcales bacterium FL481]|nr:MAG: DUF1801 domain-containing protein [Myxococcales bacterium FL481]